MSIIEPGKTYLLVGDANGMESLQNTLKTKNIKSEYMNPNNVHHQIKDHKAGLFQVLIFNSQQYGKGLELTYCDEIIVYSQLRNAMFTQVTGRLCRLGREKDVIVHKFLYI
ncbi:MAG: hypothetical protein EOP45_16010 [Sphingobacteriaceae bacterium]|nr:MAG: hypothetical protein EOP45_16010 [Sphingobacteriaceae bacterium]